jgi:hypothetical protein
LNSLREAYPQQYYNSEVVPSYESYDLGGAQGVEEEPEIVLPGEEEAYPRYNSEWHNTQKYLLNCIMIKYRLLRIHILKIACAHFPMCAAYYEPLYTTHISQESSLNVYTNSI